MTVDPTSTHDSEATPEQSLKAARDLVDGLGAHLDLPDLKLSASNHVVLTVQEDIDIVLLVMPEFGIIIAGSPIAEPINIDAETMLRMLDYNRQFPALSNGAFSIPPGSDSVVYSIMIPIEDMTVGELDKSLAILSFAVVRMKQLLVDLGQLMPEKATHSTAAHFA